MSSADKKIENSEEAEASIMETDTNRDDNVEEPQG